MDPKILRQAAANIANGKQICCCHAVSDLMPDEPCGKTATWRSFGMPIPIAIMAAAHNGGVDGGGARREVRVMFLLFLAEYFEGGDL